MTTEEIIDKLKHIKSKHFPSDDYTSAEEFLEEVCKEFGWTTGQAYMNTDFLFRPENFN